MPAAARVGDLARNPSDSQGNDCCPHDVIGAAVQGSPNVFIEGRAALRVGDPGVHSRCCGPNTWLCAEGSPNVFINSIPAVRLHDVTSHCGGDGTMVTGSSHVFIND